MYLLSLAVLALAIEDIKFLDVLTSSPSLSKSLRDQQHPTGVHSPLVPIQSSELDERRLLISQAIFIRFNSHQHHRHQPICDAPALVSRMRLYTSSAAVASVLASSAALSRSFDMLTSGESCRRVGRMVVTVRKSRHAASTGTAVSSLRIILHLSTATTKSRYCWSQHIQRED